MYQYSLTSSVDIHGMEWGHGFSGVAKKTLRNRWFFADRFINEGPWRRVDVIRIKPIGAIR